MAFEQFLNQGQDRGRGRTRRGLIQAVSLAFHGAIVAVLLVRSFWYVEELSPKGIPVTLMALHPPPPPPPAPPPAKAAAPRPKVVEVVRPRREQVVQPVTQPAETPKQDEAEEATASGEQGGTTGGVEGGVAGGVETAAPPPPPPPKPTEALAIMLPPTIGNGQRLTDLNDPRYRPTLPPQLNRGGMVVWGLFRICVTTSGRVKDVKILKSADALVDNSWTQVIHRWEHRPYSSAGRPVPFCHAARIEVRAAL